MAVPPHPGCRAPADRGYHEWRYGDPLAFLHARQQGWGRASGFAALQRDFNYFFQGSVFGCGSIGDCLREFEFTRNVLGYWYVALIPLSIASVCMRAAPSAWG